MRFTGADEYEQTNTYVTANHSRSAIDRQGLETLTLVLPILLLVSQWYVHLIETQNNPLSLCVCVCACLCVTVFVSTLVVICQPPTWCLIFMAS